MTGGPSVSFCEYQTVGMDNTGELLEDVIDVPSSNSSPTSVKKSSAVHFLQQRICGDCPEWGLDGIATVDSSIDHYYNTARVLRQVQEAIDKIPVESRNDKLFPNTEYVKNNASANLSVEQFYQHLLSLRTEYIQKLARPILQKLIAHPKNANIFNQPVDPVTLGLINYFDKIKRPMDLGTVRCKLQGREYDTIHSCFEDIRLVFQNAMAFNGADHYVGLVAKEMLQELESEVSLLHDKVLKDCAKKSNHNCSLCRGSLCLLCGEKCLKFDNPVLYCHAPSCGQKIKKNSVYFITKDGLMLWCQKCYGTLPSSWYENVAVNGKPEPRKQVKKSFLKRRFDEEIAEPWIECDTCNFSFHQVCSLYTSTFARNGKFTCPFCVLETKTQAKDASNNSITPQPSLSSKLSNSSFALKKPQPVVRQVSDPCEGHNHSVGTAELRSQPATCWKAKDLPKSNISDFMETCIKSLLLKKGFGDVMDSITIRMTSNSDKFVEVPKAITDNMKDPEGNDLPRKIKYRQKCIQLFQTIDGVDVILFCLYVQEFDNKCPPPNQSIVHIAYLDSVDYFRPMKARTMVYQEIVVCYLAWARQRGFKRCHFWACPPQRGDNFIFWCHPSHQRTPSRDRLNAWYNTILNRCKWLGVHEGNQHLWQAYFSKYSSAKRDEGSSREAAKRSFVGSGKAASKKFRKISNGDKVSSSMLLLEDDDSVDIETASSSQSYCPPIFEGDYWIQEYLRLHRVYINKSRMNCDQKSYANYRRCRDMIKSMINKPIATAFRCPVDPVALQIPTYFDVVKSPMDLGTVREKMRLNLYETMFDFAKDIRLTFGNAMTFNPAGHAVHSYAVTLLTEFEKSMLGMMEEHREYLREDITLDEYLREAKLKCNSQDRMSMGTVAVNKSPAPSPSTKPSQHPPTHPNSSPTSVSAGKDFDDISRRLTSISRVVSEDSYVVVNHSNHDDAESSHCADDDTVKLSCRSRRDSMDSLYIEEASVDNNPNDNNAQQQQQQHYATNASDLDSYALVPKCKQALLQDLSKCIQRLNDDLFVIQFNDARHQKSQEPTTAFAQSDEKDKHATHAVANNKKRGRIPVVEKKEDPICIQERFPDEAMGRLKLLHDDTSDPDESACNALMESRYTFLEMCQYRHYQFDTLRRAKYSSLMILYHLHNSADASIRPTCDFCNSTIKDLRWHCDDCAGFDICNDCKEAADAQSSHTASSSGDTNVASPHSSDIELESECKHHQQHQHPLTPYRVTFQ